MKSKRYFTENIALKKIPSPEIDTSINPVPLEDETIRIRLKKILGSMAEENLDCIIIYEDMEHGGNFEYLTGFLTRFEEALLVLHQNEKAYLILGNENRKMADFCRIPAEMIHAPQFSLPNQPMDNENSIKEILNRAGLKPGMRTGLCGWKYFTGKNQNSLLEVPYYIVEGIKRATGSLPINSTGLWISPNSGARTTNNANEIAHYEFGSALSAICVENALQHIAPGKSEMEIADTLGAFGQKHNVVSICATGERFEKANLYPSTKKVRIGDKFSVTTGFSGGLTSRAGYVVNNAAELPENAKNYLECIAKPYYGAIAAWLENIRIGISGNELYHLIETVLPQEKYHWYLNPGHLCAEEEWLSSPIYKDSPIPLKSGMILQLDIIPSLTGYGGASAENGIALADETLRAAIEEKYPLLWKRFIRRRKYLEDVLHLHLHDEVLPLTDTVAYYRPFFLNKKCALVLEKS